MRKSLLYLLFIFCICYMSISVQAQLTNEDIQRLREEGRIKGWTFEVGENSATKRNLKELAGFRLPDASYLQELRYKENTVKSVKALPSRWDWREKAPGGLPPIRNQGECGSCWAFTTLGVLECAIKIKESREEDFSEQWLVDCTNDGNNWKGCDGGWYAYDFLKCARMDLCNSCGSVMEGDYPYKAEDGDCQCADKYRFYKIKDWYFVGPAFGIPSIDALKTAIYEYGPIGCVMEVTDSFEAYTGGVFNDNSGVTGEPNHAVILVGWDDTLGNGCFIVRNSWGTDWGEEGYAYIEYNVALIGFAATYIDNYEVQFVEINNIMDLQRIKNKPYYLYELKNDIDAQNSQNLNDGSGFEPIGSKDAPFIGRLEGNKHKIKGLFINRPLRNNIGLFAYIGKNGWVMNLTLENFSVAGDMYVGSLAGTNYGLIDNVKDSSGSKTVVTGEHFVGGLVGNNIGNIRNCNVNVEVKGMGRYIGGLVGLNLCGSEERDYGGTRVVIRKYGDILNCFSKGYVEGDKNVGGLIGGNYWLQGTDYGWISNCYSEVFVTGNYYAGGFVGSNSFVGAIAMCYSTGTVNGGEECIGGFIGFNRGTIMNCYSENPVVGTKYVGGLVGLNQNTGYINNCYSIGYVLGITAIGGLVGMNMNGIVTDSYWDINTSGRNISSGGVGKTTLEMKRQGTYSSWDFTNIWSIRENSTYPYLKWQEGLIVTCPNLIGVNIDNALYILQLLGLSVGTITTECSDSIPANAIKSQNPSVNASVPRGTLINLVISTGQCIHSADQNKDRKININELLRVVQFFNSDGYHCEEGTEDGYAPGLLGSKSGSPHDSDYNPQDWQISLMELLRLIQFYNSGAYYHCEDKSEDSYCPGDQ